MLPPGHIAGGYIASFGILKLLKPDLDPSQINILLALGTFFGFAPDLDHFLAFARIKRFTVPNDRINHRHFISHAPFLWLAVCAALFLLFPDPLFRYGLIVVLAGSWSHFILDSFSYGIKWLWPLNHTLYSLRDNQIKINVPDTAFFSFWFKFLLWYVKRLSFILEIFVILFALIIFITNLN